MAVYIRGNKSICLSVSSEEHLRQLITDNSNFRVYLLQLYTQDPEIFLARMDEDFGFDDCVVLSKSELFLSQIKMKQTPKIYQIRPDLAITYTFC